MRPGSFEWAIPENLRYETRPDGSRVARRRDQVIIPLEWNTLAAAATAQTRNASVDQDGPVIIVAATQVVTTAADQTVLLAHSAITARISSGASGRLFTTGDVHIGNLFGTAQLPHYFEEPLFVPANSNLVVLLNNLGAVAYIVRLALHGIKVYL